MDGSGTTIGPGKPPETGGRVFLTLFLSVFLALGGVFTWMLIKDAVRTVKTWTWKPVECEILDSTVGENRDKERRFSFDVQYRYTFGGVAFTGTRFRDTESGFSDYTKAARLAQRYPAGARATCYVDPAAPSEAILKRRSLFSPAAVFFPLIFVAIGAGGIFFTWRRRKPLDSAPQPISDRAFGAMKGARFIGPFFSLFLVAGLGFLYVLLVKPVARILAARSWQEVPCTVISSDVRAHDSGDGTTYRVDIFYRYQFNGKEYKSNRYGFLTGSTSGHDGKRAIVGRHPPGTTTVCYVNPKDPHEAVLHRGFSGTLWFGLLPLAFVAVGAGGLIYAFRAGRRLAAATGGGGWAKASPAPSGSARLAPRDQSSQTVTLRPAIGRWGKFFGAICIAAFWNGIVCIFLLDLIKDWRSGGTPWGLTLFMTPFALIGLVMILMVGHTFLALFNPGVALQVTPGTVPLGGQLRINWEFSGRIAALQQVRITLEGREEADYRRGTTTSTDKSAFARLNVVDSTALYEMKSGTKTITVPAGLMHTFASENNRIVWALRVQGKVSMSPDVDEEFVITVLPAVRKPAATAHE